MTVSGKQKRFAYISAQRIGHVLWETLVLQSYAIKHNYKLTVYLGPKVPNRYMHYLKDDNLTFRYIGNTGYAFIVTVLRAYKRILKMFGKYSSKTTNRFTRFQNDLLGRMLDNFFGKRMGIPFDTYDGSYFNFPLIKKHFRPFTLSKKCIKKCRCTVERHLGIAREDTPWYCLHLRDSLYLNDNYREWRNTSFENYIPLISHIHKSGYIVVLMGTKSSRQPVAINGLIDYAHSDVQGGLLDLYFSFSCKGFIGGASGLALMPMLFTTPLLLTNIYPLSFVGYNSKNMTLFKNVYSESHGRTLTVEEILDDENLCHFATDDEYKKAGLRIDENSPEKIVSVFKDFVNAIDNGSIMQLSADDIANVALFEARINKRKGHIEPTMFYPDAVSKLIR